MTARDDAEHADRPPAPHVTNEISGTQSGLVVQAGSVRGGIHHHSPPPQVLLPRQLVTAPRHFVGRTDELAELKNGLAGTASSGGAVLISALAGAGGIGKTALALHWAHESLDRFPDGQLFVDLQGFSPASTPLEPAAAVRGFLDAFGVAPERIPGDLQAQVAMYRSLVAGKRMLILLDNAADAAQVEPLLPGDDTCTVVVTSRRYLTGLIARHGARHLRLDALADADARQLLVSRLGAERLAAEPDAADELLAYCGGFPLALNIVAGRASVQPHTPLTELAAELREETTRGDALDDDDPAVSLPTVLSWSLRSLTAEQIDRKSVV